jgi:hypothetical protein
MLDPYELFFVEAWKKKIDYDTWDAVLWGKELDLLMAPNSLDITDDVYIILVEEDVF